MIAEPDKPSLRERWKHWGVAFAVEPCAGPVNLEDLLIDTARGLHQNARLLVMTVTWLDRHHEIVDVGQLALQAARLRGPDSARMGLLLETAQEFIGEEVFSPVLSVLEPLSPPEPLYDVYRGHGTMAAMAKDAASPLSRKWGLWAPPLESLKPNALRPPAWVAAHNLAFVLRSLLKGDVRCKVMTALAERGFDNVSETELTHHAQCTRRAMHLALENLQASGLIVRSRHGRRYEIRLARQLQ